MPGDPAACRSGQRLFEFQQPSVSSVFSSCLSFFLAALLQGRSGGEDVAEGDWYSFPLETAAAAWPCHSQFEFVCSSPADPGTAAPKGSRKAYNYKSSFLGDALNRSISVLQLISISLFLSLPLSLPHLLPNPNGSHRFPPSLPLALLRQEAIMYSGLPQ